MLHVVATFAVNIASMSEFIQAWNDILVIQNQ